VFVPKLVLGPGLVVGAALRFGLDAELQAAVVAIIKDKRTPAARPRRRKRKFMADDHKNCGFN
jgi:hypothetical protein